MRFFHFISSRHTCEEKLISAASESFAISSFPLCIQPTPTPLPPPLWCPYLPPKKPWLFFLMSTPVRQCAFKCWLFIGQWLSPTSCWRRIGQNQSVTSEKFHLLLLWPHLTCETKSPSASFQINVASVRWAALSSRWSRQETARVCLGSQSWHLIPTSRVLVCCSCDKITRLENASRGFSYEHRLTLTTLCLSFFKSHLLCNFAVKCVCDAASDVAGAHIKFLLFASSSWELQVDFKCNLCGYLRGKRVL